MTFDDGPDPSWTPRVLDALDRVGARATFFVIAPLALEHRQLVAETLDAGHEVEFHCTEHVRHTRRSRCEVEADTREGSGGSNGSTSAHNLSFTKYLIPPRTSA